MRTRYDHLSKSLLEDTLKVGGQLSRQHEVTDQVRAVDGWFVPDPARDAALTKRGLLGRMARGVPGLLEAFHEPPDIHEVRACIHKQFAVDADRVREAARTRAPRPPFPALWVISAGRPASVLKAYGFRRMRAWPHGFWRRDHADAFGLVVVRDLPRDRDTLILRLMGPRAVRTAAVDELKRLPKDAWEREVAIPHLVALRSEVPQDVSDEDREFLMSTQSLYEKWVHDYRGKVLQHSIRTVYESRFGPMPEPLVTVLDTTGDLARLEAWLPKTAVGSPEEIAATLTGSSS